jgi:hypothetical protein
VPDRDQEAVADEDLDLAQLDRGGLPDVADRLQNNEERIAVDLELRALVRLDRVLDGELVEVELPADGVELLVGRLVEPEPEERVLGSACLVGLLQLRSPGAPTAILVDGEIDDHRALIMAPGERESCAAGYAVPRRLQR